MFLSICVFRPGFGRELMNPWYLLSLLCHGTNGIPHFHSFHSKRSIYVALQIRYDVLAYDMGRGRFDNLYAIDNSLLSKLGYGNH